MKYVILTIVLSAISSAMVAKVIAAYHFKVIDSYVKDMIEIAKKEIKKVYDTQGRR